MDPNITQILEVVGRIAGIGGLSLAVVLLIFKDVIRKNVFPMLTQEQAYQILNRIVVLVTVVAIIGILSWLVSEIIPDVFPPPNPRPLTKLEYLKAYEMGINIGTMQDTLEYHRDYIEGKDLDEFGDMVFQNSKWEIQKNLEYFGFRQSSYIGTNILDNLNYYGNTMQIVEFKNMIEGFLEGINSDLKNYFNLGYYFNQLNSSYNEGKIEDVSIFLKYINEISNNLKIGDKTYLNMLNQAIAQEEKLTQENASNIREYLRNYLSKTN